MSERIDDLLEELNKWDRDTAELIEISIGYGESEEPVLERMLARRLESYLETDDCCGCCDDPSLPGDYSTIPYDCCEDEEDEDEVVYMITPGDEDFDDDYADDCEGEEDEPCPECGDWLCFGECDEDENYKEEPEEEPEEEPDEPDELSEKLGVDVESATPLALAAAIVQSAGTDLLLQDALILRLGKRGKNIAQLTTLVEGL